MAHLPFSLSCVFLIVSLLMNGAGCGGTDEGPDPAGSAEVLAPCPTIEWLEAAPEEIGMDRARLEELQEFFEKYAPTSLLVIRKGYLVWEKYYLDCTRDTVFETFSVTKSFTSAAAGIAVSEGLFALDRPAADFIASWRAPDPRSVVKIRDLLTMTSGLEWSYREYFHIFFSLPLGPFPEDLVAYALARPLRRAPGTRWTYNESALMVMSRIFAAATGIELREYARNRLFEPIGMHSVDWLADAFGQTYTFLGLQATSRDLARFGYLFLRRGRWEGRQVIPESWVDTTTRPYRTDLNPAYGYLWWANGYAEKWKPMEGQPTHLPLIGGHYFSDVAPADTYAALGFLGQLIVVIPELDLVLVRTGISESYDYRELFPLICRTVASE